MSNLSWKVTYKDGSWVWCDHILEAQERANDPDWCLTVPFEQVATPKEEAWWRPQPFPRDGSPIVMFDTTYERASNVLRWNEKHQRLEGRNGYSTGIRDECWTLWCPAPQPEGGA